MGANQLNKSKRESKSLSNHNFRDFAKVCFFIGIFSEPDLRVRILLILFLLLSSKHCLSLGVVILITCHLTILNNAIISDFQPGFEVFCDVSNIYTLFSDMYDTVHAYSTCLIHNSIFSAFF